MGLFCFNCNLLQEEVEEERMKVFVIANFRTNDPYVCVSAQVRVFNVHIQSKLL